jgi:hypothetical protein
MASGSGRGPQPVHTGPGAEASGDVGGAAERRACTLAAIMASISSGGSSPRSWRKASNATAVYFALRNS